jgi:dienelactone hydrolase
LLPVKASVSGPFVRGASGVWLFRPAGRPKEVVIYFHGQGGPTEATPVNHREWIDHLVSRGAVVIYPRYELSYSQQVLAPAVAGIRRATKKVDLRGLPVLSLGYSRGGAIAVEYAAVARDQHVPVPDAIESVNPVPIGEQTGLVALEPISPRTLMAVIVSDRDPHATDGASLLLNRLRNAGFPGEQIRLHVARSHGGFSADHLAPLSSQPAARAAYWVPTDELLSELH